MRQIAEIKGDDGFDGEDIMIYASLNNGQYSIVLSNGDDSGLPNYDSLEELERSVEAAWGNWFTFRWSLT